MRLLHMVAFSKKLRWLAQSKVITLKTQLHAVNTRWKRLSQLSFRYSLLIEHNSLWFWQYNSKNNNTNQITSENCIIYELNCPATHTHTTHTHTHTSLNWIAYSAIFDMLWKYKWCVNLQYNKISNFSSNKLQHLQKTNKYWYSLKKRLISYSCYFFPFIDCFFGNC